MQSKPFAVLAPKRGGAPVGEVTFANLTATPFTGMLANVSDSNTATWGATVAAGGANHVLARFNGSVWTVVGK